MRQVVVDLGSQPLRNLIKDPKVTSAINAGPVSSGRWFGPTGSAGTYTKISSAADGAPGQPNYVRKQWTAITTGAVGDTGFDGVTVNTRIACRPGDTVTYGAWIRTNVAGRSYFVSFYGLAADGTTTVGSRLSGNSTVVPTNTWTWVLSTVTIPAGRTDIFYVKPAFDPVISGSTPWAVGDWEDITGVIGIAAAYSGVYVDGDTPGWRWTGAANASESVGYPYTLQSIAGTPDVVMSAIASTTSASLSSIGATQGRTLYVVHDVPTLVNSPVVARFGSNIGGIARVRLLYTGPHVQWDGFNTADATIGLVNQLNARAIGRHTAVLMVSEGVTRIVGQLDGGIENIATINSASDRTIPSAGVYGHTNTDASAIYLVAYRGEHNLETRKRITAWLARMYGSPIPSGY